MISQTNSIPVESTNQSTDIPQQLQDPIVTDSTTAASKSKWDDDDDTTTDSVQQNQTQAEP
jgi:hypothetical protein